MTKPIHYCGKYKTITPCGKSFSFHSIRTTNSVLLVTCKKCKKTNWVKELHKEIK